MTTDNRDLNELKKLFSALNSPKALSENIKLNTANIDRAVMHMLARGVGSAVEVALPYAELASKKYMAALIELFKHSVTKMASGSDLIQGMTIAQGLPAFTVTKTSNGYQWQINKNGTIHNVNFKIAESGIAGQFGVLAENFFFGFEGNASQEPDLYMGAIKITGYEYILKLFRIEMKTIFAEKNKSFPVSVGDVSISIPNVMIKAEKDLTVKEEVLFRAIKDLLPFVQTTISLIKILDKMTAVLILNIDETRYKQINSVRFNEAGLHSGLDIDKVMEGYFGGNPMKEAIVNTEHYANKRVTKVDYGILKFEIESVLDNLMLKFRGLNTKKFSFKQPVEGISSTKSPFRMVKSELRTTIGTKMGKASVVTINTSMYRNHNNLWHDNLSQFMFFKSLQKLNVISPNQMVTEADIDAQFNAFENIQASLSGELNTQDIYLYAKRAMRKFWYNEKRAIHPKPRPNYRR